MLVAGYAVVDGSMTLGGWIAVQSWVTTIFVPLNFLGTVVWLISFARMCIYTYIHRVDLQFHFPVHDRYSKPF